MDSLEFATKERAERAKVASQIVDIMLTDNEKMFGVGILGGKL